MINEPYRYSHFKPHNDFLDLSYIGNPKYGDYKKYNLNRFSDWMRIHDDSILEGENPDDPFVFEGWKKGLHFVFTQSVALKNLVITNTTTPFDEMVRFGKYYFENVRIDVNKLEYQELLFDSCKVHFKNCIIDVPSKDDKYAGIHFKNSQILIEDSQITGGIFANENSQIKIVNSDIIAIENHDNAIILDNAKLILEDMNLTTNKMDYLIFPEHLRKRLPKIEQVAIQSQNSELLLDKVEYLADKQDKFLESSNDQIKIKNLKTLNDISLTNCDLKMESSQCRTLSVNGEAKVDLNGENTVFALKLSDQSLGFIEKLRIDSLLKDKPIQVLDQARLVIEELHGYKTKDLSEYVEVNQAAKSYILADQRQAQGTYSKLGLFIFKHDDKKYRLNFDEKELKRLNRWLLDNQETDVTISVFEVDNKMDSKVVGHIKYVKGKTDIINALKMVLEDEFGDVQFIKGIFELLT